jgi:hypothetical protein
MLAMLISRIRLSTSDSMLRATPAIDSIDKLADSQQLINRAMLFSRISLSTPDSMLRATPAARSSSSNQQEMDDHAIQPRLFAALCQESHSSHTKVTGTRTKARSSLLITQQLQCAADMLHCSSKT